MMTIYRHDWTVYGDKLSRLAAATGEWNIDAAPEALLDQVLPFDSQAFGGMATWVFTVSH